MRRGLRAIVPRMPGWMTPPSARCCEQHRRRMAPTPNTPLIPRFSESSIFPSFPSIHWSNDAWRAPLLLHSGAETIRAALLPPETEPWSSDLLPAPRRRTLRSFRRPHRVSSLHFTALNYCRPPPASSCQHPPTPTPPPPAAPGSAGWRCTVLRMNCCKC